MTYIPAPIDTSRMKPDKSLEELIEKLAENVHDVWARQRMAEGWTYGPKRDDDNKKHPCIVEYSALSDSEQEYDRQTAMETVKCILSLGYRIQPPE